MTVKQYPAASGRASRGASAASTVLLLAGLLAGVPIDAAAPPAAPYANAPTMANAPTQSKADADVATGKCPSVVMRNCRARFVADPSAAGTPAVMAGGAPGLWEAVRTADLDSDEILVEEDRIRDPAVREVFERYLRAGPAGLITRNATGGARCTTIASTGATFCSHPGAGTPSSGLPSTDFSDGVF